MNIPKGSLITDFCVNHQLCNENIFSLTVVTNTGGFYIKNYNNKKNEFSDMYKNEKFESGFISVVEHPLENLIFWLNEDRKFGIFDLNSERVEFTKEFDDDLQLRYIFL